MSSRFNKDYLALQNLWFMCAVKYMDSEIDKMRMKIMDDFRDCLIDIKSEGKEAIRSNYERWEKDIWIPFCKSKLAEWIHDNAFEACIETNKVDEFENIKQDYNYQRYRKIMQLIQDSGIGLGQGSGGSKGYYFGADNHKEITG